MNTQSNLPDMDPRVAALSRELDALVQAKGCLTDMVSLRKRIRDLGLVGLTAFDERCRAALYSAASQSIATHRGEVF